MMLFTIMAPHQDECSDNNIIWGNTNDDDDDNIDAASPATVAVRDPNCSTVKMAVSSSTRPKSILRKSIILSKNTMPTHWPGLALQQSLSSSSSSSSYDNNNNHNSNSVTFAPYLITCTNFRPRTHILDIPNLYYSPLDIARFKREYKRLVREQKRKNNLVRLQVEEEETTQPPRQQQQHDNTFWRSKVGRRWTAAPNNTAAVAADGIVPQVTMTSVELSDSQSHDATSIENDNEDLFHDPLNDGTFVSSSCTTILSSESEADAPYYGGIFSSVFDVAREAVSILNGGGPHYSTTTTTALHDSSSNSNGSKKRQQQSLCSSTSLHLVDTLYLF